MRYCLCLLAAAMAFAPAAHCQNSRAHPRAIVVDLANLSSAKYALLQRSTTDSLVNELVKRDLFEVASRKEVDDAAKARGMRPPYSDRDLGVVARDIGARFVITGELREADIRTVGGTREYLLGLVVRVRDIQLDEVVNGAAEWGDAPEPPDGRSSDGLLYVEAAASAAFRVVARLEDHKPIEGTIMNSLGPAKLVMNRGMGHGVRGKQEFVIYRDGRRVGRARVFKAFGDFTELVPIDATGGIRPEDRALAVFPEPKLGKKP